MEPTADTSPRTSTLTLRTLVSVMLILLLSLVLSGVFEYLRLQARAAEQAAEVSRGFGRSSAILIQPLVLSDDRISLNYLLNELTGQPLVNGLRLTAPDQTLIALAGEQQGRMHSLELVQGEVPIGQLSVWSDPAPFRTALLEQLIESALLLGLCLSVATVLITLSLRRQHTLNAPARAQEDSSDFASVSAAVSSQLDSDRIPDFRFAPTTPQKAPTPAPDSGRYAEPPTSPPDSDRATTESHATGKRVFDPLLDGPETGDLAAPPSATETAANTPVAAPPAEDRTERAQEQTPESPPTDTTGELDTGELVSLLKPAPDNGRVPRFTPRPTGADPLESDRDEAMVPDIGGARTEAPDEFALDELGPALDAPERAETTGARSFNPLTLGDEEESVLYTFEQELELMLTPEEAGYLLLIDTRSAHSDNVDEAEREQLLRNYRTLAASAARIYSGEIETLKNGDLRLLFSNSDDKDSHGINALCCAMLFTYLYKQYNQQQIRAFRPVMNLHMALVRGAKARTDRMQEEAGFLTRTTQSNELISHTALTEATLLKEMLLQQADIRREDEDKVLILGISQSYQELLEKQAYHLLDKLNERERGASA